MANKEVDSRIVEMQFDGKDFDNNIRRSQKNLEDFKKSLNFEDASRQMSELSESGSIGSAIISLTKNVKKLTDEFAGFGRLSTYVAKRVKNAWEGSLRTVERFTKSLTTEQITAGHEKYDKLLKSVQTIMNATGDSEEYVYSVMQKLNKYTDETSYNYSDMAQNIGKFTTAGINLEDAEEEMEGIANWAALAGQGTNEAQRAMYNISQAMSAGYMQKIDWKSIQNANMDIRAFRQEALDAAVAAGTLKKSKDGIYRTVKGNKVVNLDNFTDTLQYKWFDKKTMEIVFKTFADNTKGIGKEAYKAAQRCTTLTDAFNAWKDMLSTGWMKSYEHIFGKLSDAMALFSGLCNKVSDSLSKLVDIRNGILEGWNLSGGRNALWGALFGELESPDGETLFKGAYGLLDMVTDIGNAIREAFWEFIGLFVDPLNQELYSKDKEGSGIAFLSAGLTVLTEKVQNFTKKIKDFLFKAEPGETETRFDRIKHVAQAVFAAITLIVDVIRGAGQFVGEIIKQLRPAIVAVEQLIDGLLQMFTGDVAKGVKNNTVGKFFHGLAELLRPVTTVINVVVRALAAMIAKFIVMMRQSGLLNVLGSALKYISGVLTNLVQRALNSGFLQTVFEWIQRGIAKIPELVQRIKELGISLTNTAKQSKAYKGIVGLFSKVFDGKNFKTILANLKNWVVGLVKGIPSILSTISGGASGIVGKISDFFGNLIGKIFGLNSANAESADKVAENLGKVIVEPIERLGSTNIIGQAIDQVKPGFLQRIREKLAELWHSFSEFFVNLGKSEGIRKIKSFFSGTNFKELLTGAKDILKWLAIFRTGSGLVSLGKGFKSIGKGVKVFGKNLKNLDLKNIFSNMFNISNIINSNNTDNSKRFDFSKLGNQLFQFALAIGAVVAAAYFLAKLKPDELKQAGISLGIIIAALVGASYLAKKIGGSGGSLLALAAAVIVLLIPMKTLQQMDWGVLLDGVAKLAVIMFSLAGALRLAGNTKAKGFVSMALALTLLLIPLKSLMKMPIGDLYGGGGLVQGMLFLVTLLLAVGGALAIAGNTKAKGFISLAVALTLLLIPIKTLANMELGKVAQGVVAILAILTGITLMVKITDGSEKTKLAGIVAAITALAAIGWLIGHTMDWKQALIGFVPIVAILGMMALMLKTASKLTPQKIKGLVSIFTVFTVLITVISGVIIALNVLKVDQTQIIIFFAGVIGILLSVGAMCALIGSANSKAVAKIGLVMLSIMGVVVAIGGSLVAMSMFKVNWSIVTAFFVGIVAVLVAVGAMIKMAFKTNSKGILKATAILGVVAGLVLVAAGGLSLMAHMKVDWKMTTALLLGITALVGVIGLIVPKLAAIQSVGAAVKAVVILAAAVAAVMGVIALMAPLVLGSIGNALTSMAAKLKTMSGLLKDFFDRMGTIDSGSMQHAIDVFDSLKELILRFAGFSSYAVDIRSVMSQLNYLGAGLDMFFVNDKKYPDPESSMSFKVLGKFIEISPSLASFSVGNFPEQVLYMGVGLMLFNEATKDITTDNPKALGLLQGIFGQADNIRTFTTLPLEAFSGQMSALGGAMSLYAKGAKEVTGLETGDGKAPDISKSIEILKAVCSAISGDDGSQPFEIPDNMPDSTQLGLFAGNLESLGTALSTFASAANKMETNTGKATELLSFLAEIGGYVTKDNLKVVDAFDDVGHVDENGKGGKLGQFALDIGALGTALSTFASNIGGKEKEFDTGITILEKFEKINSLLTKDSLKFAKVFDDAGIHQTALGVFADDIGALGHSLASFAQNVTLDDGSKADFDYALSALSFMATLQNRLPNLGGLDQLIHGEKESLGRLATDVQEIGQALRDFSDAVTGTKDGGSFNVTAVKDALDVISQFVQIIAVLNTKVTNVEETDVGDILYKFAGMLTQLNDAERAFFASEGAITDGSLFYSLAEFAQNISKAFQMVGGIDAQALEEFKNISAGLASLMTIDPSVNFHMPGKMISEGIAEGVEEGRSRVVNSIVTVVQAGIDAGKDTAQIKSPSKVFAEMGQYMDLGLVKGISDNQNAVENASSDMAQSAMDEAGRVMALISQAMADSVDFQPTISPVLDLSSITNAGSKLDSFFSGYALDLDAAVRRANMSSVNNGVTEVIVKNPTDLSSIQGSISTLQGEISELQSAITNMKVVLNTGVIAGGITDDIDINLGLKNLFASRRN